MSKGTKNRIGPYLFADGAMRKRKINDQLYIIGIAGAFDFGEPISLPVVIGSEHNGIFILNDTKKTVLADQYIKEDSGYYGPSPRQWEALAQLMRASSKDFFAMVKAMPRYRGAL